jgi:hypothetical protein
VTLTLKQGQPNWYQKIRHTLPYIPLVAKVAILKNLGENWEKVKNGCF